MKVTVIPEMTHEAVRARDGVRQNDSVRRRPAGFRLISAGYGSQEEAEARENRARQRQK